MGIVKDVISLLLWVLLEVSSGYCYGVVKDVVKVF